MRKLNIKNEGSAKTLVEKDRIVVPVLIERMVRLNEIISSRKKTVIVGHKDPDGDAFGSALAFKHYLRNCYSEMEATVVMPNTDLANTFNYLPGWCDIIDYSKQTQKAEAVIGEAELIVCLDFNNWNRLGRKSPMIDALKKVAMRENTQFIRIDHHERPDVAAGTPEDSIIHADFTIVKPERPFTCEILTELFGQMDMVLDRVIKRSEHYDYITKDCATCLFNGIMTDTINFSTRHPSAKTFSLAVLMDEFNKTASNYVLPNRPPKKGYSVALSMHFYNKDDKQHIAELEKQYMKKYEVKFVLVKNELTNQLTTVEL